MNKSSIALVALLALLGGFLGSWYLQASKPFDLQSGLWFGAQSRALPAFELIDHELNILDNARLKGHWNLMFFGYSHCPDICPVTLQLLADMMATIDDSRVREAIKIYFVSVDPQRDQAENLAAYVHFFNTDFIGASAPMDQLRVLTGSLGIAHQIHKASATDLSYAVDHSSAILLIDPAAKFAGLFSAPQNAVAMAGDMTRLVRHF